MEKIKQNINDELMKWTWSYNKNWGQNLMNPHEYFKIKQ